MGNPYDEIKRMSGLWTHGNPLNAPDGGMLVADNVEILREDTVTPRRGYRSMSTNLPAFHPDQLLVIGGIAYLNLDSGLWYYDTASGNWLRKAGTLGAKSTNPIGCCYQNGFIYYNANAVVMGIDLSTGRTGVIAGRFGVATWVDGTGDAARFSSSMAGIAGDGTSLYVCDGTNNRIRKIASPTTFGGGVVTTIAGSGAAASADGTGTAATINQPLGICFDGTNLYVTDSGGFKIRKLAPPFGAATTVVTTIAGSISGTNNGTGAAAQFTLPAGICFDGTSLYVADIAAANSRVRKIAPPLTAGAGVVTTIANTATNRLYGIAFDGTNLIVSNDNDCLVYKVAPPLVAGSATVSTFAGSTAGWADGIGTLAKFNAPEGLFYDGSGTLVCDFSNNAIRKIYPSGYVITLSGVPGSPAASVGSGMADGILVGPT